MDRRDWDARYEGREFLWDVAPNVFVERYLADLPPDVPLEHKPDATADTDREGNRAEDQTRQRGDGGLVVNTRMTDGFRATEELRTTEDHLHGQFDEE